MKFPWYIWIPRILIILLIAFMALFSLDVFEGNASIWNKLLGLLMHNLPALVLLLILLLTWKRPFWAGIIFLVINAVFTVLFKFYRMYETLLSFTLPPLIASILFILAHFYSKNKEPKAEIPAPPDA